jgi:hypothetical protein
VAVAEIVSSATWFVEESNDSLENQNLKILCPKLTGNLRDNELS